MDLPVKAWKTDNVSDMESTEGAGTRWFANGPEQFCWADWPDEEEAVLFHQGSGDTLMLNPLGEYLLKRLQQEQLTHQQLSAAAADYFHIDNDAGLTESIVTSLRTFRSLGLVVSDTL